jgi:hypothetical protein
MTDDTPDPYTLPDNDAHPADIAGRVMQHAEHRHLAENEVAIGWLMRTTPKVKGGKTTLGSIHDTKTMAQGGFKDLFAMLLERLLGTVPQYLVVLDLEFWNAATDTQREALVWHELAHCRQATDMYDAPKYDKDGNPVYALVSHDIEAFRSEVTRFGAWTPDIAEFIAAASEH